MPFEYILLVFVSVFPIKYKFSYWSHFFSQWDQSLKNIIKQTYHFWLFVEIPIFIMSFVVFFDKVFEIFLYNIFFYFLILYNIFVFWKILRWNSVSFVWNKQSYVSFVLILLTLIPFLWYYKASIYLIISILMIFIPAYFYVSQKIVSKTRTVKI